jgi:hypothetical protein
MKAALRRHLHAGAVRQQLDRTTQIPRPVTEIGTGPKQADSHNRLEQRKRRLETSGLRRRDRIGDIPA